MQSYFISHTQNRMAISGHIFAKYESALLMKKLMTIVLRTKKCKHKHAKFRSLQLHTTAIHTFNKLPPSSLSPLIDLILVQKWPSNLLHDLHTFDLYFIKCNSKQIQVICRPRPNLLYRTLELNTSGL